MGWGWTEGCGCCRLGRAGSKPGWLSWWQQRCDHACQARLLSFCLRGRLWARKWGGMLVAAPDLAVQHARGAGNCSRVLRLWHFLQHFVFN